MLQHNKEAEASVLAAIMFHNDLLDAASDLKPSDFYTPEYAAIFETMLHLYNQGKVIDLVTLKENCKDISINTLIEIQDAFYTTETFNAHKKIVIENAIRRRTVLMGQRLMQVASEYEDIDELLAKAEDAVLQLRRNCSNNELHAIGDVLIPVFDEIVEQKTHPECLRGCPSSFNDINSYTHGWRRKGYYVVAARPSMGKSSWLIQELVYMAKQNIPVLFFSLEMSKESVVQKIIQQEAMVSGDDIQAGTITNEELKKIKNTANELYNLPLIIDDTANIGIGQMRTKARKVKKQFSNLGVIGVDYLQFMGGEGKERRQIVEENSKGLKALAKELDCAVICLAQLSRAPEARTDKRPVLSDLRETGQIEQDADMVAFLYRDEYYNPDTPDKSIAEFIIRKMREGRIGTVKLGWLDTYTCFTEYGLIDRNRTEIAG